jgi:4-hydroxybutyrate CoA-transferase
MGWKDFVARPVISSGEAAALVANGDTVAVGLPEPVPFLLALADREELEGVTVMSAVATVGGVALTKHPGVRVITAFASPFSREAVQRGEMEFVPVSFHAGSGFVQRLAPRVAVVLVAEPQPDGAVRPGMAMAFDDALVRRPRADGDMLIGLVDSAQPQIPGEAFSVDDFDAFIELPPAVSAMASATRKTSEHAGIFALHLSELIPDGATLQAGVGGVPDDALSLLVDKKDLGIHTEVLGQGLVHLMKEGIATGARKTIGADVATFTIADPSVMEYLDGNEGAAIAGAASCLDPRTIADNSLLRCVNSAVEIDLLGQVNAEMIKGKQYSGVGGQLDFFRACRLSDDALSILVIESTAAGGQVSRIVPWIGEGALVTSSRYDIDVVITEHGVAWLRDATVRERAAALISVAEPSHRDRLNADATRLGLLR